VGISPPFEIAFVTFWNESLQKYPRTIDIQRDGFRMGVVGLTLLIGRRGIMKTPVHPRKKSMKTILLFLCSLLVSTSSLFAQGRVLCMDGKTTGTGVLTTNGTCGDYKPDTTNLPTLGKFPSPIQELPLAARRVSLPPPAIALVPAPAPSPAAFKATPVVSYSPTEPVTVQPTNQPPPPSTASTSSTHNTSNNAYSDLGASGASFGSGLAVGIQQHRAHKKAENVYAPDIKMHRFLMYSQCLSGDITSYNELKVENTRLVKTGLKSCSSLIKAAQAHPEILDFSK
jgi:hypothetical protein